MKVSSRKNSIPDSALVDYAATNSWRNRMNSGGLDSWSNYSGPDLGDLVVVAHIGQSRDSEILAQSNFSCALDQLGGESDNVQVHRFGHWGCGWFEIITVNPHSKKHLKLAYKISEALEDYPVLDESDYSEREHEYQSEFAASVQEELAEALSEKFKVHNGPTLKKLAYGLNIQCQQYVGNDSCINIYSGRAPDKRDLKRLQDMLSQLFYEYQNSLIYKALVRNVSLAIA